MKCTRCGQTNHVAENCTRAAPAVAPKRRTCKRCGIAGHYQATCMALPVAAPPPPPPPPRVPEPAGPSTLPTLRQIERIAPPAPAGALARVCSRCGTRGHDVRSCTMQPPSRAELVADDDDDLDEDSAADAAEAIEADASPWDPDDVPTAPPAVTVPAPKYRRGPRLVTEPARAPAPLTLVMFTSSDHGVTAVAHELALSDVTAAVEIVDAWDCPAILARGVRLVHVPARVPFGLAWAAYQRLRGAR